MNYLQIDLEIENAVENEILIALLSEAGFESFEESERSLKAFIKETEFRESALEDILQIVPVNYTKTVIPQQNWNAAWERSFDPIVIKNFAAIRAAFHQPIQNVRHEMIITPKMSFGTGHHATTYMMIEQMEGLDFTGKTVLDFGTGTAVLAILAEKMGAASVDAIDHDTWSIENALENAAANQCTKIHLVNAETIAAGSLYDIVLANINLQVIIENLAAIKSTCKKGTLLLLSGFINTDETMMIRALADYGIVQANTFQKGEWICLAAAVN